MSATQYTLSHLHTIAVRAHNGTSFNPERRGDSIVKDYSEELDADIQNIRAAASKVEAEADAIAETCARYKEGYTKHLCGYLHSRSNIVSTMIVGPARFPVAQMEKRNRWADNKYNAFRTWRRRILDAINRSYKKRVDPLAKAIADIAARERAAIKYRLANQLIRKHKGNAANQVQALVNAGYTQEQANKLLKPDFAGRIGIAPYVMTNNNANIKRLKSRVAELSAKAAKAESGNAEEYFFEGGKVLMNYELDRLQILYDAKPDTATITKLKRNAFKWSPKNTAWQRQLTRAAKFAAIDVTGASIPHNN